MTMQAQTVDAQSEVMVYLESIDHMIDNGDTFLNSVDLMIADLAKGILFGTLDLTKEEASKKLDYLTEYGDPYSSIPPSALKVINNLRFLIGA